MPRLKQTSVQDAIKNIKQQQTKPNAVDRDDIVKAVSQKRSQSNVKMMTIEQMKKMDQLSKNPRRIVKQQMPVSNASYSSPKQNEQ